MGSTGGAMMTDFGGFLGGQPREGGVQGVQLAHAFTDPDIVVGQFMPGALPVLLAAPLDQRYATRRAVCQIVAHAPS